VPTKIGLKVDFLKRDFERDHLAEKSKRKKMGQNESLARLSLPVHLLSKDKRRRVFTPRHAFVE
jgi:hypothetical protein